MKILWQYNYTPDSEELYHHGVMGQKWGVKNGPPYPLSRGKSSNKMGGEVAMQVAATVVPMVATAAAYYAAAVLAIKRKRSEDKKKDEGHTFSDLNELEKSKTLKSPVSNESAAKANPKYDINDPSTTTNCPFATIATELRFRGYDVEAQHMSTGANCEKEHKNMFKESINWEPNGYNKNKLGFKKQPNESTDAFNTRRLKELSSEIVAKSGKGTRGCINASSRKAFMGHIFNYTVDNKGKVTFIDGQSGSTDASKTFINCLDDSLEFSFARLDNLELDSGVLNAVRKH